MSSSRATSNISTRAQEKIYEIFGLEDSDNFMTITSEKLNSDTNKLDLDEVGRVDETLEPHLIHWWEVHYGRHYPKCVVHYVRKQLEGAILESGTTRVSHDLFLNIGREKLMMVFFRSHENGPKVCVQLLVTVMKFDQWGQLPNDAIDEMNSITWAINNLDDMFLPIRVKKRHKRGKKRDRDERV